MDPIYTDLATDSFLAALIYPFQGDLILAMMAEFGGYSPALMLTVASVAGVAGFIVNWAIGRSLIEIIRREPIYRGDLKSSFEKSSAVFNKNFSWMLLLSGFGTTYVPLGIGLEFFLEFFAAPLTIIAGILRMNFLKFLLFVTIAKFAVNAFVVF